MYQQGDFAVMINWPALPLWHGATMMPAYVLIFYPVFLFTGFKVVESLSIEKRWQAAVAVVFIYVACLAAMVIGNIVYEGAVTQYIVVQTVGLIVMSTLALFPILASRRRGESPSPDLRELASTSTASGK
jgi:hypothetical protein